MRVDDIGQLIKCQSLSMSAVHKSTKWYPFMRVFTLQSFVAHLAHVASVADRDRPNTITI